MLIDVRGMCAPLVVHGWLMGRCKERAALDGLCRQAKTARCSRAVAVEAWKLLSAGGPLVRLERMDLLKSEATGRELPLKSTAACA